MNAALILVISIVALLLGYIAYGSYLAKQWGIDPSRPTPSHEMTDGVDYVSRRSQEPARSMVRFRQLFSAGSRFCSGS